MEISPKYFSVAPSKTCVSREVKCFHLSALFVFSFFLILYFNYPFFIAVTAILAGYFLDFISLHTKVIMMTYSWLIMYPHVECVDRETFSVFMRTGEVGSHVTNKRRN